MAKYTNDELLEAFGEMTLVELSEFVKAFEEKFDVEAAAPVAAVAAAPAAGAAAEEEKDEFDVILSAVGDKKIQVIKAVRAITNLGLAEAKALVDGAPKAVLEKAKKEVDRTIREYLPFLATENIMMEAVKRGGNRQELHEKIRQHSMAATARMKEGEPCDLLDRLAADPAFGMTRAELDAVMEPSLYIGRCKEQVENLLAEYAPLLADAETADGAISL